MINQYITFFTQHWILSALFIFTLVVIIIYEMFNKVLSTKSIAPQETVQLMNRQNGIVIDIRDQDSFKKEHIAQAINVPLSKLEQEIKNLSAYQNRPIIVVSDSDQIAIIFAKKLLKSQFQSVQILGGGLKAWKTAGLPLTKG